MASFEKTYYVMHVKLQEPRVQQGETSILCRLPPSG